MCVCCSRSRRRELPEIFRLRGGSVLCTPLLVQDLQAGAERGPGVHEAQAERHSRSGDLPALWLWRRSELQDAERRSQQGLTKPPHMPETLRCSAQGFFFFTIFFFLLNVSRKQDQSWKNIEKHHWWKWIWNGISDIYIYIYCSYFFPSPVVCVCVCVSISQSGYKCFSMEHGIWWLQYITVL